MDQFQADLNADQTKHSHKRKRALVFLLITFVVLIGASAFAYTFYTSQEKTGTSDDSSTGYVDGSIDTNTDDSTTDADEKTKDDTSKQRKDSADGGWLSWLMGGGDASSVSLASASTTGQKGAIQTLNILAEFEPSAGAEFDLRTIELRLVSNPVAGSTLSEDKRTVTAPSEGVYRVQSSTIRFSPTSSFVGEARGVSFSIADTAGVQFSGTYAPVVKKSTVQPSQPTACSDPSSQGYKLLAIRQYMPADQSIKTIDFQWSDIYGGGSMDDFYTVDDSGHLYRSSNDGQTWTHISPNATIGSSSPYVVADGSRLYVWMYEGDYGDGQYRYSSNRGDTWSILNMPHEDANLSNVSNDGQKMVASHYSFIANEYHVYYTNNGGVAWAELSIPANIGGGINTQMTGNGSTLYVSGYDSVTYETLLYKSADGGQTWDNIGFTPEAGYNLQSYSVRASLDGSTLLISSYNSTTEHYMTYRSTDAGATWQEITNLPAEIMFDFNLSSDGSVMLATSYDRDTYERAYYLSRDAGTTWNTLQTPSGDSYINNFKMSDDGSVLLISGDQTLFTRDDGQTWNGIENSSQPFDQTRIDLDPSTPGQQLVLDKSATEGWIVGYDRETDRLYSEVTDDELFPMPQELVLPYTLTPRAGCANPVPGIIVLRYESLG